MRLTAAFAVTCLATGWLGLTQARAETYGYIVEIPAGQEWLVTVGGRTAPIAVGSVLRTGDRLSVTPGTREAAPTVSVMEYSSGGVVRLQAGQVVPQGRPPRQSSWAKLGAAIGSRLNNERLSDGLVRARVLLKDALHVAPAPLPWASLVADLPPGDYRIRFRRRGADGQPAGDWTGQSTIAVSATGITPATYGSEIAPGLWQVSIRHQQTPSIGGDAWLLVTADPEAARQYADLVNVLTAAESANPEVAQAAAKIRRAALLSLAPGG